MKQNATIMETKDSKIIAGCDKSLCGECHASLFCKSKDSSFEVLNPEKLNIEKGDKVEIDMPSKKTLTSIFLSLGLPLALFIPGYFIGKIFTQNELLLLLWGIGFMAIGFLFASLFFKKKKNEYTPSITRVLEKRK